MIREPTIKIELTREEALAICSLLNISEKLRISIVDKFLIEIYPEKYTAEQKEKIRKQ